jgi:hypothetical protein
MHSRHAVRLFVQSRRRRREVTCAWAADLTVDPTPYHRAVFLSFLPVRTCKLAWIRPSDSTASRSYVPSMDDRIVSSHGSEKKRNS